MIYNVRHATRLTYAAPVAHAHFNLRLTPTIWPGQFLHRHHLRSTPVAASREDLQGPYCVNTTHIAFQQPLRSLEVISEFNLEVTPLPLPGPGPSCADLRQEALAARDLSAMAPAPYLFASRIAQPDQAIGEWAADPMQTGSGIIAAATSVMAAIHREFTYRPGATTSATRTLDAFARREGVCQDFAHVMIAALRAHGLPAAYVSGYLRTQPPPGKQRLVGADAMHAWVNVWCGQDLGWIGFDPTNDCLAREDHILIAMGRDYADVAPIDGVFIGQAPQKMKVAVDVIPAD